MCNMPYKKELSNGNSLEVFQDDKMIFHSKGKWLMPLFQLEDYLNEQKNKNVNYNNLSVHDTAIGKAAAVLLIKMGVRHIYGNLVSSLAVDFIETFNKRSSKDSHIEISWNNIVNRLMCATEAELADIPGDSDYNINHMYFLIRQRGKKVWGLPVTFQSVTYKYGNIHNLSFNIKAGGHLIVTGENGAGKSTLLRLLAGIYKPVSGNILIDNKDISKLPKFTIGYIPQFTDDSDYSLSVKEVVGLGIKHSFKSFFSRKLKSQNDNIINSSLKRTSSEDLLNRSFSSLSGGEKQKVSLARCLAQNAKVILLDEPTASLDAENRKMVIDIVRSLTITEIPTIIIVTHDKALSDMPGWDILNLDNLAES